MDPSLTLIYIDCQTSFIIKIPKVAAGAAIADHQRAERRDDAAAEELRDRMDLHAPLDRAGDRSLLVVDAVVRAGRVGPRGGLVAGRALHGA